jgi:hypothetical protein
MIDATTTLTLTVTDPIPITLNKKENTSGIKKHRSFASPLLGAGF